MTRRWQRSRYTPGFHGVFCWSGALGLLLAAGWADALPSRVGPDHVLEVGGKPFFPLGIYDAYQASELAAIADLGYNLVEVPYGQVDTAYLDEAQRLGLHVLVWFGGYGAGYLDRVLAFIGTHKDHPAILGWFTIDEPANFDTDAAALEAIYRAIKAADPSHIVFNNFNSLPGDAKYKDSVDIFGIDPYPIVAPGVPGGNVASVGIETRITREAIGDSRPVWVCPQAFGELAGWQRAPSAAEYRVMHHLAVIHGAKGLIAYTYRMREGTYVMNNPALQDGARKTNRELAPLAPQLLARRHRTLVKGQVHVGLFETASESLLLLANASHLPTAPELNLHTQPIRAADAVSGQPIETQVAALTIPLPGYGVRAIALAWDPARPDGALSELGGDCGPVRENLSLLGKVSSNSILMDDESGMPAYEFFTDRANDGRPNTQWASADRYDLPVWLQVTLPEPLPVNRLSVTLPGVTFYDNWKAVRVEFSDGSAIDWTLDDTPTTQTLDFDTRTVEWVRVVITSTYKRSHYVGCTELGVYHVEAED